MPATALGDFLETLRSLHLLDSTQLNDVAQRRSKFADAQVLAKELIRRSWLSPYQVNQIFQGKGKELVLGSYAITERLGGGGMGDVFKARNWKLGQIVALKVIRKDRLQNPNAVRRFQREVRAASHLSHPNIVKAFDADQAGEIHYFAMEYVPGSDLAQRVKQSGPVPVVEACEYIRQAALGLQHAHERGLVHRDIKPNNFLVTPDGVVKLLDMGLPRMEATDDEDSDSTLTRDGAVVGTLDYLAPEQAMNSHTVDIRADLYSLGCTFYFLLTGKAPFQGGMPTEKLLKHRLEEPEPVEKHRPEVPASVTAIVRKLMAKRPVDRYQKPIEVVAAIDRLRQPQLVQRRSLGRSMVWLLHTARRFPRLAAVLIGGAACLFALSMLLSKVMTPVIHPVLQYEMKPHPADAVEFNGHWYKFFPNKVATWQEAQSRCQELGGYLVCIQDAEENAVVIKLAGGRMAWLGGNSDDQGNWHWLTGDPFPQSGQRWWSGTLNTRNNGFLQIYYDGRSWHDLGLNALPNPRWASGFICEWEL